jgi:hypothetical protein
MTTYPHDREVIDDEPVAADRIPQLRLIRSSDCDRDEDDDTPDESFNILAW